MIPIVIMTIESDDDRTFMSDVYVKHRALMVKIARNFTSDNADIGDIISESCVALIKHIDSLRDMEEKPLRSYVAVTTKSKAIDLCRKKQREQAKIKPLTDDVIEQTPDPLVIEQKISLQSEIDSVKQALQALPEKERETLRMRFFEEMEVHQIAEVMGITENAVYRYIMFGRQHLKAMLYEGSEDQ